MKILVLSLFLFLTVAVSAQDANVSVRRANLRDMPSVEGKIITKLQRDEPLEIIEQLGVWYNVRAKGFVGWLHRSTFELNEIDMQLLPDTPDSNSSFEPKLWPPPPNMDQQIKERIKVGLGRLGTRGARVAVENRVVTVAGTIPKNIPMGEVYKIIHDPDAVKVINKLIVK